MTEFKFDLDRSNYFNTRAKLLANHVVPKLSDAKRNLGEQLAKVVFNQCDEALREEFGLKIPLKGPGDILWVSPSDLLIGKVALKPPFTPKCLQALTHKGILEIGLKLENQFIKEMELEKQRTLEKYKADLLATVEDRMKAEIKDVEIRERLICTIEKEKQQQEFQNVLKKELKKLENTIRAEYAQTISENEDILHAKWQQKLQEEVKKTVDNMTSAFLTQIEEQEERLTKAFQLELRKREILRDFDAKMYKRKITEALRQLKHNLECTNLVNMLFILCTERKKCCDKKQDIENYYQKKIAKFEKRIEQKDEKIKNLTKDKAHQIQEVILREKCLLEIIKHFQKFINFALKASPTQAEFLLSVEKMMTFELTKEIVESKFPEAQEVPNLIPWQYEAKEVPSLMENLEIPDYHKCLDELSTPPTEEGSELDEDTTLPVFHFKNKMYIREDLRDMLLAGKRVSSATELWNRDVKNLFESWSTQFSEAEAIEEEEEEVEEVATAIKEYSVDSIDEGSVEVQIIEEERRRSKQSTVQFSTAVPIRQVRPSDQGTKRSTKSSIRPSSFPIADIKQFQQRRIIEPRQSNLLAAKDSLEVIIQQKVKSGMQIQVYNKDEDSGDTAPQSDKVFVEKEGPVLGSEPSETSKELVVETKDSVILRKTSLAKYHSSTEFTISPRDSIEIAKLSLDKPFEVKNKLTSARNSVDLLRESLSKLREPAPICLKKNLEKNYQQSRSPTGFSDTCCERCKKVEDSATITSNNDDKILENKISRNDSDERSVKISKIQVIKLEEYATNASVVSFHVEPTIFHLSSCTDESTGRKTATKKKSKKKVKKNMKPCPDIYKVKVLGDANAKEGEQSSDEFTAERIHSLIHLMKSQPQLMQLFTSGFR